MYLDLILTFKVIHKSTGHKTHDAPLRFLQGATKEVKKNCINTRLSNRSKEVHLVHVFCTALCQEEASHCLP